MDKVKFEAAAKAEKFKNLKSISVISNSLKGRKCELEGYLFPEIYTFTMGMSEEEILTILLKQFEESVTEADYEKLKTLNITQKQNYTMDQIIISSGLPPGPICSPGVESIQAALEPEAHSYLFYVTKMDGSHAFSKTLPEHNKAVSMVEKERNTASTTPEKTQ